MKRKFTFLIAAALMLLTMMATTGTMWGQTRATVTDHMTASNLAATGTSYTAFSNVSLTSDAVYAGRSALNNNTNIQLRSSGSNCGIVTTTSGGKIKSITITVASGSNKIDVYGKNSAYTNAEQLYNSNNQGTKLGTVTSTGTITVTDDYEYVGIRSYNGAVYISSIDFVWDTGGSSNLEDSDLALTGAPVALNFDLYNNSSAQVINYTTSSTGAVTVSASDYVTTSVNETAKTITVTPTAVTPSPQTITVSQTADATYSAGSVTFTVTITNTPPAFTVTLGDDSSTLTEASSGAGVTLPTRSSLNGYDFAGWSETNVNPETTTAPIIIAAGEYHPTANITLYPVYSKTIGGGGSQNANASVTIADYANAHNWGSSSSTNQKSITLNSDVTATCNSGTNSGKYYSDGWRIYQTETGKITITTTNGTLSSVTFTFTVSNTGTLNYNSSAITSGTAVNVSGTSAEFTVGNSGSATNGQVRITAISVNYTIQGSGTTYYWSSPVAATVETPAIVIAENPFYFSTTATITCATEGAAIKYSFDGANWSSYSAALTITETTTIYAKAIKDEIESTTAYITATKNLAVPTVTIDATNITNTDVFTGTAAGSLSASITYNEVAIEGATVTWSGDADAVATIDASTGAVTLVAAGSVTFTATYAGNGDYSEKTATYQMTVTNTDPNIPGSQNNPYTVAQARAAIDAGTGVTEVYATGIVSEIVTEYSTQWSNITFDIVDESGDAVSLRAYRCGGDDAANVQVNDIAVIYGNLTQYGEIYEFASGCQLVSLEHPIVTEPTITVTPATVNVSAEGEEGTLTVTYDNINEVVAEVYFCDAQGGTATYDWITAEINSDKNVYYIIDANDGEARTAYLKVYALDDNAENVYSNLVTINQDEYVAPTYATLPFSFDGGIGNIANTDGLYQEGLGSDYSSSPKLKFDGTGDWLLLQFQERPGTLTFNIKNNSFSGGTFTVQTSEDGVTYTDLQAYTEITGTQNEEFTNLGENVRYIKWIYTEKSSGNVGLGNIALTKYVAPVPAITVESTSIAATAEETQGTLNVTYTAIETDLGASIYWYTDNTGTTTTDEPNWISAEINQTTLNVYYLIEANTGAARTAYFKVCSADAQTNLVYSELVTVNQAAASQNYNLTVEPFENLGLITFVDDQMELEGDGNIQVTSGAQVMLSVVANEGYVIETLMVNGVDHAADIDANEHTYSFAMPGENVTISATAVEYIPPVGGNYVRINDISYLTDGAKVIIAARYDEDNTDGYYAMQNATTNKPTGVLFTSTTENSLEVLPSGITDEEDDYYWIVGVTENGYTFTNANGQLIGYNSGTNFATGGNNIEWNIEFGTSDASAMVANYEAFTITNHNNSGRGFALNSSHNFGPYATSNYNSSDYNFYLDFFVLGAEPVVTPSISLSSYSIEAPAEPVAPATEITGSLTVTLNNITIAELDQLGVDFCDEDGNILTGPNAKPSWFASTFELNNEEYKLNYTIESNTETTARVAYFKVYEIDSEVYSDKVTVTQEAYVAPTPVITVNPDLVEATFEETEGTLSITLENIIISQVEDHFEVYFCDEEGNNITENKPNWLIGEVQLENNVFSLYYLIEENTETVERTAYMKVYGLSDDGNTEAYSNKITFTQAGYVPPVVADNYELFSGDLVEGDYLIVYDGVAMNNTLSGKRFGYDEVTITNNTISNSSNTIVWHIAPSETTGYWTLYNVEKEKYASNGGSSMDMSLSATSDNDNTLWSVTAPGETTHEFRNKNNESQSARYLRRNGTYGFACYATGTGGPLSLYKKVDNTPSILLGGDQNIGTTHATGKEVSTNFTVTQYNLTADITLTTSIGALSTYSIEVDAEPTEVTWTHTFTEPGDIDVTITATSGETTKSIHITGEVKQSHLINIADVEHGTIAVVDDKTTAIENENVDFTVTPDEGYVIDEIIVMAGENQVEYMQGETFYRFQMPDSDVTISATFTETVSEYYELFSGDLVEGDYLIVYDGVAMNNTLSGKRFGYDEVTITNNTISNSSNTIVWHIAPSETTGYWTLYNVEKEKYASNGGSSMDMSLSATSDNDNTLWSVTAPGETTHEFRNKNNESQSARYLRRNGTYGFACYATGTGGPLSLYKKVDNTPSLSFNGPTANIGTYAVGEEIVWDNITVTQHNLTENILLSAKKGTVNPASIDAGAEPTQVTWSYTPTAEGYTTDTITATSGTLQATLIIQFMAKTPHNIYTVVENGIIVVLDNKTTAIENENVDFTVTPDEGYELNEITVMAGETPVEYMIDETFYRFQMPDSDVTINATFNALPKYTIKFYVNGNQDEALTISDIVEGNSTPLPTASTLTPAGFSIAGWAESGSTIAVADPYTPTDNVDLYALFQLDNAQTTSGNYVKVTEELTDWSGEYLIVYEDGNVAFDGSLTTLDANGNTIAVTLTNNTIEATTTTNASKFTIVTVSGGYSILSASGYFIGQTTNENGLLSSTTEAFVNTISYDTENNCVNVISSGGAYLRYNSDASRFRYYKSSSYTGQKAIQLYKKESTSFNNVIVLDNTDPEQEWTEPIPESTCVVVPNNVTLTYTGPNPSTPEALVVQEGGQLIHTADVEATVQKSVSGYTNKSGDGWYLISSPVDNLPTSSVATGTYDLFAYDEATAYWWVDHAIQGQPAYHTFTTLERGKGYLYANAANVNLNYAGTMKATDANITVPLSFACDEYPDLKGFNLVGNPFTRNITATDMVIGEDAVTSYYDFNDDRTEFVTYRTDERPIQPGQGFFIQVTANSQQLEFNPASPKDASDFKYISISAGDENFTDKAYIQFGYGNTLRKMTFGENTMVYVMNNDDDYAAARVEELAGTIPVHFVPIEDGFYTITVETKNIENLNYMHLIDNIKNTEIDLLVEPSYTFKASESDNADRFYLVFDFNNYTGVNENYTNDNFAHQIGDEIFVSGEGTLQVFDMLGRFVAGYNVNGDKRISTDAFNTGVYIFRMVGTDMKTQKIVVR